MALYAFDGTWQDAEKQGIDEWTNVKRFVDRYGPDCNWFYVDGTGTRYGMIGKLAGGALGHGPNVRIKEAFSALRQAIARGDDVVDIIGFSRGAATACQFAWRISRKGVKKDLGVEPQVRFLGLWDTVFYVMDVENLPFRQSIKMYLRLDETMRKLFRLPTNVIDLKIPPEVSKSFHALALHEVRPNFKPTRVQSATEVWFAGVHSDVGGGSVNKELSDITLAWMIRKARECGVPVNQAGQPKESLTITQPIEWPDRTLWRVPRDVRAGDTVHPSAKSLDDEFVRKLPEHRVDNV